MNMKEQLIDYKETIISKTAEIAFLNKQINEIIGKLRATEAKLKTTQSRLKVCRDVASFIHEVC